jgi:hypothetical protein
MLIVGILLSASACSASKTDSAQRSATPSSQRDTSTGSTSVTLKQPTTEPPSPTTEPTVSLHDGAVDEAPPCAAGLEGAYGASTGHPERAPLQAQKTFGQDRWAICGADISFSGELLSLRSTDRGADWEVSDTGLAISPYHAGDRVRVSFDDFAHASIRLVSLVASQDDTYGTTDGGTHWVLTRRAGS